MAVSLLRTLFNRSLALVALAAAAAGPAQAVYVVGNWDPDYGTPFGNLGWRGTITIEVPSACLASPVPAGYTLPDACGSFTSSEAGQALVASPRT